MAERESASAPVQPEANRREGQPTAQMDAASPPSEAAATAPPPMARQLTPEEREAHPEWHGSEAARHLGLPEAEPGYEWYFDPTDSLSVRYRRSQGGAEKLPKKKWNSETNAFEVDAGEIDFPARYKGETRVYENIDRAAYEEALHERDRLIAERDLHRAETEEWRRKNAEVAEKSRQIGAAVAEEYIRKEYPGAKKLYGGSQANSNAGDFDDVYIIQEPGGREKFIILETKGGSDSSSKRMVGANKEDVAEQGSPEYFDAIIGNMRNQAIREENSEMVIWLDKLEKAKRSDQKNGQESVVYRKVIVPIKTVQDGNGRKRSELFNPKIKDYDLSEQDS
jgi:Fe-S cluster biosynthesis and repair protein YggX